MRDLFTAPARDAGAVFCMYSCCVINALLILNCMLFHAPKQRGKGA